MPSPVALVLKLSGTRTGSFRSRWGFTKSALAAAVNGTFVNLPPRMIEAVEQTAEFAGINLPSVLQEQYGAPDLSTAYGSWQHSERAGIGSTSGWPGPPFRSSKYASPVTAFMKDVAGGRDQFGRLLKVPPGSLYRWETGIVSRAPVAIENALREVKYPHWRELIEAQAAWLVEWGE